MRLNYKKIIIFFFTLIFMIMALSENLLCQSDADVNLSIFIMGYDSSNTKFTPMSKPSELTLKTYYDSYFTMKGMNFIDYSAEGYWTEESHQSIDRLKGDNVNYVAINVIIYQNFYNSSSVYKDVNFTPATGPLVNIIAHCHLKGMNVFFKVMVDPKDGHSRTDISPSDTDGWFASYKSIITQYARMAQTNDVEMFSVGCELKNLSGASYFTKWQDIINSVDSIYTVGDLIYCANWNEYENVSFWDHAAIDYMGIDAYFPLNNLENPSFTQISNGWRNYGANNWVNDISTFRGAHGKDIIFTEIGYRSANFAAKEPWKENSDEINLDLQVRCYKAAMEVWNPFTWFKGIFWWDWGTKIEGAMGDNHHFEFDYIAWTYETYHENMACYHVAKSSDVHHEGIFSLKMDFDLKYLDANKSSGMAYWDIGDLDLRGKTISTYFYCPGGSQGGLAPNGVTIFVKDTSHGWYESDWKNITTVDNWFKVTFDLPDEYGIEHISKVGVKVGTPTIGGSSGENDYNGPIYIDDYIWYDTPPEGDNHGFEFETINWTYEAIPQNKAVTNVGQSSAQFNEGSYSLKLDCHLILSNEHYSKGMAYWNVGNTNLRGKQISTYFYCPDGSQGGSSYHNGVSIFAKDTGDFWHEGDWQNIETTDSWFKVTWNLPDQDWTENIKIVGVKLGTPVGGGSHAENDYDGPIYIDDFVWTNAPLEGDNHGFESLPIDWYPEGDACNNVEQSSDRAYSGNYSLKMDYSLACPANEGRPGWDVGDIDLEGKTISVWVYCPSPSGAHCDCANGVLLYAKDTDWDWKDGGWNNIINWTASTGCVSHEDQWWKVTWTVASIGAFDAHHVKIVGIKIGSSTSCGGCGNWVPYTGPIYIDDYTW